MVSPLPCSGVMLCSKCPLTIPGRCYRLPGGVIVSPLPSEGIRRASYLASNYISPSTRLTPCSSGRSLLAHMENFPTGTLALILTNESATFMPSTINAACSLLFALGTAYSHARSTPTWPATLTHRDSSSPRHGSATKRTLRSLEYKRRDYSSGASSPRGSSSPGQNFRRLTKGPVKYEMNPTAKTARTATRTTPSKD